MSFHLFIFHSVACDLVVISMRSFPRPMSRSFISFISSTSFMVFLHLSLWVNLICEWCKRIRFKFYSFTCDYPTFPASFVEDTVFIDYFGFLFKYQLSMFFSALYCSFGLCLFLCQYHKKIDSYSLIVQLEIRKCGVSCFVLSQVFFVQLGFFVWFHKIFRSVFFLLMKQKYHWNLDRDYIGSIDDFEYGHFKNNNFTVQEHRIPSHLFVSSLI